MFEPVIQVFRFSSKNYPCRIFFRKIAFPRFNLRRNQFPRRNIIGDNFNVSINTIVLILLAENPTQFVVNYFGYGENAAAFRVM